MEMKSKTKLNKIIHQQNIRVISNLDKNISLVSQLLFTEALSTLFKEVN